jgi:hypothetical protein
MRSFLCFCIKASIVEPVSEGIHYNTVGILRQCNAFVLCKDKEKRCRRHAAMQPYSAQRGPDRVVTRGSRLSPEPNDCTPQRSHVFPYNDARLRTLLTRHSILQQPLPTSRSCRTSLPKALLSTYVTVPATRLYSWQQAPA